MCKEQYPDDPIIDQVVLRNRGMELILAGSIVSRRTLRVCGDSMDAIVRSNRLFKLVG